MVASLQATLPPSLTYEIILVDDGSSDGTRAWLATLAPPFRVLLNPVNLGYGEANNRGAAIARGELLALLNNDLVLTPGWLEPMLAAYRRFREQAGVIGNVHVAARTGATDHAGIFINHKGKPEHVRRRPSCAARAFAPYRRVPAVTGACVLLARSLWTQLRGFDSSFHNGCEDIDLCFRAAAAGKQNVVALRSRVAHHVSAAPGRKARDEVNTYALARRWQETLALLGQRDWCRHHFATFLPEPRNFPDPALARQIAWYLLHLRSTPPPAAAKGMREAMAVEFARWKNLCGEPSPARAP